MGYLIGAAVLAALGVVFWVIKGKKEGKSNTLSLMETSRVKDVQENFTEITNSMGSGSFTHMVEVKGKAFADDVLNAELSGEDAVYVHSTVIHEYEKLETQKKSDGSTDQKWVKKKDTVSDNKIWSNGFGVKDDTGFVLVDPAKSKFHDEQLFSKFEKGDPQPNGLHISIKGFTIGLGGNKNKGIRTIGYRYVERGIRLGTPLYVVGQANDRDGHLEISRPSDKKEPFIVSVKSKDEFIGNLGSAAKGLKIGAFVSWAGAAALIVVGLWSMMK